MRTWQERITGPRRKLTRSHRRWTNAGGRSPTPLRCSRHEPAQGTLQDGLAIAWPAPFVATAHCWPELLSSTHLVRPVLRLAPLDWAICPLANLHTGLQLHLPRSAWQVGGHAPGDIGSVAAHRQTLCKEGSIGKLSWTDCEGARACKRTGCSAGTFSAARETRRLTCVSTKKSSGGLPTLHRFAENTVTARLT